jgi:uncharacterized protein (TIGR00730 family)
MKNIKSVCVYCAHHSGDEVFQETAHKLGVALAKADLQLVYGGGKLGLMGIVADAVLANDGRAVGYITHHLDDFEGAHTGIQELHYVDTMHTRKMKMSERADAFVVLPGGFGTLDEFFEIITWKQLMLHDKPIIIVNINNYWSKLIDLMYQVVDMKFALPEHRYIFTVVTRIEDIVPALHASKEPKQQGFLSHVV